MPTASPFKFLDSYTVEDADIFFGRDEEVEEVYKKVLQGKTLFIYGESGTGKSSLINCGLANRFEESDWQPINVSRGENINDSLLKELDRIAITKVRASDASFPEQLFKYTRSVYLDYFKPLYFIFDQFEELYLLGTEEERKEFISGIQHLAEKELEVYFIFIIRAEYLHFLLEFEEQMPEILENRLRIEKITKTAAVRCIEGPCKVAGIELEEDFAKTLINRLALDKPEVELTYLQVFLDKIYREATETNQNGDGLQFKMEYLDRLGQIGDVLSQFLEEQLQAAEDPEVTLNVLKAFVSTDGTKRQVTKEQVMEFVGTISDPIAPDTLDGILMELIRNRIIRELEENLLFELRHDSLADRIFQKITKYEQDLLHVKDFIDYAFSEYSKRGFILNESDLSYISPFERQFQISREKKEYIQKCKDLLAKKKRGRKFEILAGVLIALLLIISLVVGFVAIKQGRQARLAAEQARESATEAERQRAIAEQQQLLATANASEAEQQRQNAIVNEMEAERQAVIATENFKEAAVQAQRAREERERAIAQQQEAEAQRALAEEQRQIAEQQSSIAQSALEETRRLSMISTAVSLANKSITIKQQPLKSLLAVQGYDFYSSFDGYPFNSSIYNSLHFALKDQEGENYNELQGHGTARINQILKFDGDYYSLGDDGKLLTWIPYEDTNFSMLEMMKIEEADLETFKIKYMAVNRDDEFLINTGNNLFWRISESRSESITLPEFKGPLLKMYAAPNGWHIFSRTQMVTLTVGEGVTAEFTVLPHPVVDVVAASDAFYLLSENQLYRSAKDNFQPEAMQITVGLLPTKLAMSEFGDLIAIGQATGEIRLFNLSTGNYIDQLTGHTSRVSGLAFSENGLRLVSGGFDRTVHIWDLENFYNREPIQFSDHNSFITALYLDEKENRLFVGELDGTIKYYELDNEENFERLCQQTEATLSQEEWTRYIGDHVSYEPFNCQDL